MMKIKLGDLRELVTEAKIAASAEYAAKEKVREDLQARIVEAISRGDIRDQKGLEDYFSTIDMSLKALKMVPFQAFVSLAGKKRK